MTLSKGGTLPGKVVSANLFMQSLEKVFVPLELKVKLKKSLYCKLKEKGICGFQNSLHVRILSVTFIYTNPTRINTPLNHLFPVVTAAGL